MRNNYVNKEENNLSHELDTSNYNNDEKGENTHMQLNMSDY